MQPFKIDTFSLTRKFTYAYQRGKGRISQNSLRDWSSSKWGSYQNNSVTFSLSVCPSIRMYGKFNVDHILCQKSLSCSQPFY